MVNNRKRGQSSSWTVAPEEEKFPIPKWFLPFSYSAATNFAIPSYNFSKEIFVDSISRPRGDSVGQAYDRSSDYAAVVA
jgi:hypothetical protein